MVNTSARPIAVDGVRLDTLAWNVEKVSRATASLRSSDYEVPNLDGAIPSLNDALEPSTFGLEMWLRGTDQDGVVPAAGGLDTIRANLDELLHLFGQRYKLLEVTEQTTTEDFNYAGTANPSGESGATTGWTSTPGTGGAAAVTNVSGGSPYVYTRHIRLTWSTASTAAGGGLYHAINPGAHWAALTLGKTYTAVMWVRPSIAQEFIARPYRYTAATGGTQSGPVTNGPATTAPAGVWTPIYVTFVATLQPWHGMTAITAVGTSGSGVWPAGATLDGGAVDVYEGAYQPDRPFQDGRRAGWAWTGATDASLVAKIAHRRALCKATDSISPELAAAGVSGRMVVGLSVPSGQWEDLYAQDWSAIGAGLAAVEVDAFRDATERLNDAIFVVQGPATTPRITDPATGMWVELGVALTSTQVWRFNSATWASRYGAGLSLTSLDTAGTDGAGVTAVGGPSRGYGLPLTPTRDTGARRIRATLSAASGLTAASGLFIRGRRKFAA